MINMVVTLDLPNLAWSSDWNGDEVGFPESEVVGLYSQERYDGTYSFYIDIEENKVLDFWKDDEE